MFRLIALFTWQTGYSITPAWLYQQTERVLEMADGRYRSDHWWGIWELLTIGGITIHIKIPACIGRSMESYVKSWSSDCINEEILRRAILWGRIQHVCPELKKCPTKIESRRYSTSHEQCLHSFDWMDTPRCKLFIRRCTVLVISHQRSAWCLDTCISSLIIVSYPAE